MTRITIPAVNWHTALAEAIKNADEDTIIVVSSEAKKELALIAAKRMNKDVKIEVGS